MEELINKRLDEINPLRTLSPTARTELLSQGEVLEPSVGTIVFREGDEDDFNVYLLQGAILTERENGTERTISAEKDSANYALGNLQPRPFTAHVSVPDTVLLKVSRARIEATVTRSQVVTGEMPSVTVTDLESTSHIDGAWMFQVLQSALFRGMPTENIERFFAAIERTEFEPGKAVIEQGDPGDYFYMVAEGECEVMRSVNGIEFPIATLAAGDSFGEEALISGLPRNATVRSKTDAVLMRLNQENFQALFEQPAIRSIDGQKARQMLGEKRCQLIDVRMESEHGARSIRGSQNIPLYRLRKQIEELDQELAIVTYCDSGTRSKVAAFLLCQRGLDAAYLEGGLSALLAKS